MGSALSVPLGRVVDTTHALQGGVSVRVTYKTRESKALQWLDPQYVVPLQVRVRALSVGPLDRQTQGKTHPYLFSQCQPIYARALVPIQGAYIPSRRVVSVAV